MLPLLSQLRAPPSTSQVFTPSSPSATPALQHCEPHSSRALFHPTALARGDFQSAQVHRRFFLFSFALSCCRRTDACSSSSHTLIFFTLFHSSVHLVPLLFESPKPRFRVHQTLNSRSSWVAWRKLNSNLRSSAGSSCSPARTAALALKKTRTQPARFFHRPLCLPPNRPDGSSHRVYFIPSELWAMRKKHELGIYAACRERKLDADNDDNTLSLARAALEQKNSYSPRSPLQNAPLFSLFRARRIALDTLITILHEKRNN